MAKRMFFLISIFSTVSVLALSYYYNSDFIHLLWLVLIYIAIGTYDLFSKRNVLVNYPVIGHLRYMFEAIRPEIQQYFIESNSSGRPFSREQRSVVYQRAKKVMDTIPFGTQQDILNEGYEYALHSLSPTHVNKDQARVMVGGADCTKPYSASRLNVSAMSFGALSSTAIESLNWGAKLGHFCHNTGEGGLSPYHLKHGGDLVLQIGTSNFGFRNKDGSFSSTQFKEKAAHHQVKMIEIKLSQGAKPAHGGLLPGAKVDEEIAEIRGIEQGVDCYSPAVNPSAKTPLELIKFVDKVRRLSGGKPVGFKLCIGNKSEFFAICKAMLALDCYPDFITVDGAEGGTGAAPLEFSNRLGLPLNEGLSFVNQVLIGLGLRDKIKLIAAGKIITGFDMLCKMALGADICNSARGMMFAIGCIQSRSCNNNECPTGIATQDPKRIGAVDPAFKRFRVKNYHQNTIHSFLELVGAMGLSSPDALTPYHIQVRMADSSAITYGDYFPMLKNKQLIEGDVPDYFARDWQKASAEHF